MRQLHAHQLPSCPCARLRSDRLRLPPHPQRLRFNACYASADNSKGYLNFLRVAGREGDVAASDREDARKDMRTVFDFNMWRIHRDPRRHASHLSAFWKSRILRSLRGDIAAVVFLSLGVAVFEDWKEHHPSPTAGWAPVMLEASDPFQLTGFALSLLLAFRLNASYTRWVEARTAWSSVTSNCRELMRQAMCFLPGTKHAAARHMLAKWLGTFPKALMYHVREDCDLRAELLDVLEPEELKMLLPDHVHKPNLVLNILSGIVHQSVEAEGERTLMDERLGRFADAAAVCERLVRSPIPRSYTRHTSRFLSIWLSYMPWDLWRACHWAMVPVAGIVAYLLLSIEEIGVQMEEPFGILPLEVRKDAAAGLGAENCVETIQINLQEMVQQEPQVAQLVQRGLQATSNRQALSSVNGANLPARGSCTE